MLNKLAKIILTVAIISAMAYYALNFNRAKPSLSDAGASEQATLQGSGSDAIQGKLENSKGQKAKKKPWKQNYLNSNLIEIITPSSGIPDRVLTGKMQACIAENIGIEPKIRKDILDASHNAYSSNSEEYRFNHVKDVVQSEDIGIIWSGRGGYGSQDIISHLVDTEKPEVGKIYVGYSDATNLLLFFNQFWGWQTVHGHMPCEVAKAKKNTQNLSFLKQLLIDRVDSIEYKDVLKPANSYAKEYEGKIQGVVTGGNLSIVESTLATSWEIDTDDKILIIEESSNDRMYRIDRMLNHLRFAGKLDNIKALVLSGIEFPSAGAPHYHKELFNFTVKRLSEKLEIPIYTTEVFGHGPKNYPFVIGSICTIEGDDIIFSDIKFSNYSH